MHAPPACYVVEPGIWAGSYIGAGFVDETEAHISWLIANHIDCVIDLSSPDDQLPPYADTLQRRAAHISHCAFPIRDGSVPSPALMCAILDAIADAQESGQGVYIHCWGGVGRTGTVVACWYMRRGMPARTALELLNETRRVAGYRRASPDYHAQLAFVEQWSFPDAPTHAEWMRWRSVFRGCLLGAALGNAIGVTNDMRPAKAITPIDHPIGGGLFDIAPGGWTDETAMLLCLAESMIHMRGFDARDVADRFLHWWRDGYMTCAGRVYEVGNTTRMALYTYQQTGNPLQALRAQTASGNGSVTRIAPLALVIMDDPTELLRVCAHNSLITHGTQTAIDACRYAAWLLVQLCLGVEKRTAMQQPWPHAPLADDVAQVVAGSYRTKILADIRTSIDVSDTLEAALWALWHHDDYASGALVIANLGGLSESCGQLYGTFAGACYGEAGLPTEWLAVLQKRPLIGWVAEELLRTAWKSLPQPHSIH